HAAPAEADLADRLGAQRFGRHAVVDNDVELPQRLWVERLWEDLAGGVEHVLLRLSREGSGEECRRGHCPGDKTGKGAAQKNRSDWKSHYCLRDARLQLTLHQPCGGRCVKMERLFTLTLRLGVDRRGQHVDSVHETVVCFASRPRPDQFVEPL